MPDPDTHLSFYFLCALLLCIALRGLFRRKAMFEFPSIAAMIGLAWVVPQGIELGRDPSNTYDSDSFWLYVGGCFLFIFIGFANGKKTKLLSIERTFASRPRAFSLFRLLLAATGLTLIGSLAIFLVGEVDTSQMGGQWTGVITLYALLARANALGLCLAVLIYARTGSRAAIVIAVFAAVPIISWALFYVRREQLFDVIVLTFGAWYMAKDRLPPLLPMIAALLVGTVIINSAANLRGFVQSGQGSLVSALLRTETYTNFDYTDLKQGKASEVGLAQFDHSYMDAHADWEFGAEYWNALVHQYVPAFLSGRDYKNSLQISTLSSRLQSGDLKGRYSLGSTRTGFSDSYRSFGIFGVLIFGLIGWLFGDLFAAANSGSLSAQFIYLILFADGLKSITHSSSEFFAALPFILSISLVALWFARNKNINGSAGSFVGLGEEAELTSHARSANMQTRRSSH